MKNQDLYINSIFVVLILSIFPITYAYAEEDLNQLLNGVYAQNEQWVCSASPVPYIEGRTPCPECWSTSQTGAGEITYYGDGTAHGEGRVIPINNLTPDGNTFIGTYSCDWEYQVNDDLTFSYSGDCVVRPVISPETITVSVTNQRWYGQIGKNKKMITVERHDGEIEGLDFDGIPVIEQVCGKTGVQIKIKDL